ncbi:transposase (fragment) [Methylocella tundrae]|uniref:Transposase n=2 Tax=Methylocella tundrae TaxID=227605 RepID=A0A4U8Z4X1_METTU
MARAGVPEASQRPLTKPEIALQEIDRLTAQGVRFGAVLADAGYGLSAAFRQGLSARGLFGPWAFPNIKGLSRRRFLDLPCGGARPAAQEPDPRSALGRGRDDVGRGQMEESQLAAWRQRSPERPLRRPAHSHRGRGAPQRILDKGQQHMPGEEAWLVGEWRSSGERKYYLANLPAKVSLKRLAAAIKARWVCEQGHQQMKEELGLDHFEGRSWRGLHRHALMTMIAYAFLQHQRLKQATREKKESFTGRRNRPSRRFDAPSSRRYRQSKSTTDVPIAECASGVLRINSAKVVLGSGLID